MESKVQGDVSRRSTVCGHFCPAVAAWVLLLLTGSEVSAQVLYEGALGTLPSDQGWTYLALPGTATQSLTSEAVQLNTSAGISEKAGYFAVAPVPLNSTRGFCLLFTMQLHTEFHTSNHRAGFSVIVLGQDHRGIELGFWTNQVFAQSDSPLFTQAENSPVDTASSAVEYALVFGPTNYVLRTRGNTVLAGPLRNYTVFVGTFDPYETADFLFLGDDTSSAWAVVSLSRIALVMPPQISVLAPGVINWTGVSNLTYSVERSSDLQNWASVGSVTSASVNFRYTNSMVASNGFFRVVWP